MKKLVRCTKICVDCVPNDPVDIRCGGPHYLGFDFYVKQDQTDEMIQFIMETLNNLSIPLEAIYKDLDIDLSEDKVWTRERILSEIKKDTNYLKMEASRKSFGQHFF